MTKKIEISDTLVEYGPGTVDLKTDAVKYTYLEFSGGQRIHNAGILRSAQTKFEAMQGVVNAKFIFADMEDFDPIHKTKLNYVLSFGPVGERYYRIGYLGDAHPEIKRAISAGISFGWIVISLGILFILLSPLFLLLLILPGIFSFGGGIYAIYTGRKFAKNFEGLRNIYYSVARDYPKAIEL